MARKKEYEVRMVIKVEPDAPFLELENGDNTEVILDLLKDTIYDLDDVGIREIEVEFLGD